MKPQKQREKKIIELEGEVTNIGRTKVYVLIKYHKKLGFDVLVFKNKNLSELKLHDKVKITIEILDWKKLDNWMGLG